MEWSYMFHIGVISASLLIGALLRARVKVLKKFLIPSSIIAGFFLLLFYNYGAPLVNNILKPENQLNSGFLGDLVYHLLNISFIAMMLRIPDKQKDGKGARTLAENTVALISQYGLQCLFGLLTAALLIATFMPDLFPAIGFTLPLGFELGPGQAYSMTLPWEAMGFQGATSVGLSMAAIGFLAGSIGGVILINIGIRKGWVDEKHAAKLRNYNDNSGFFGKESKKIGSMLTTDGESIDSLTYHLALVFGTYLVSAMLLSGITRLLALIGPLGVELGDSLWGINFVFSTFCAIVVRNIIVKTGISHTVDTATFNRISGFAVDLTVAASLGAISLVAVAAYWLPIICLTVVGLLITCIILPWFCSRLFTTHQFYRTVILFGTSTGTLPTGLALLRIMDPDFETPVASDFIYATGVMFFFAIPIILSINLPAFSITQNNPLLFWAAVGISALYVAGAIIAFIILSKKRAFAEPGKLFYSMKEE